MENAVTTVISLLFMFGGHEYPIDEVLRIRADICSPAPVIIAILGVDLLVILMFRLHVLRLCDIARELLIGTPVDAYQLVVTVTDSYLGHGSLDNCGLIIIRVQY